MFKSRKNRNLRKRRASDSDASDNEADTSTGAADTHQESLEEYKIRQNLRKRQNGVSAEELAAVKVKKKSEKKTKDDPFKIETGGFVDMKTLKTADVDDEVREQIGTAFASETNRRDEDAEMVKYVEQEMSRRKGDVDDAEDQQGNKSTERVADSLYDMPEHIKAIAGNRSKKSEDMLSNQMLSGIPEVDLGIMAKIKNIEQTEEAKQRLIQESMKKKEEGISLVPTNYAVNFSQHNRFNIQEKKAPVVKKVEDVPVPVRVGDVEKSEEEARSRKRTKNPERASDDAAFNKFRKNMRF